MSFVGAAAVLLLKLTSKKKHKMLDDNKHGGGDSAFEGMLGHITAASFPLYYSIDYILRVVVRNKIQGVFLLVPP